eukprot:8868298-Pyramimonas_sp.AAC.1
MGAMSFELFEIHRHRRRWRADTMAKLREHVVIPSCALADGPAARTPEKNESEWSTSHFRHTDWRHFDYAFMTNHRRPVGLTPPSGLSRKDNV